MSLLQAALAWAGRGFRVFPLAPGTKIPPKDFAWKAEATTDPARLTGWWSANPAFNVGVATGGGLVVVDVDTRVDGAHGACMALDLPDTLKVNTPGGGYHLYFLGDDVANSAGKLGRGIDVRGAGGYVVAPGSYFADHDGAKGYKGGYVLADDLPPVAAPPDLILRAGSPREKQDGGPVSVDDPMDIAYAIRYLQNEAPPAIEGEGGNNTAYQVAARLHEIGLSADTATALLAEHWNPRCAPPWEHGALVAFAAHAELYAQNRQGSGGMAAAAEAFSGAVPLEETQPEPAAPRELFLEGGDLLDAPFPDWLIEDIIPEQGLGLLAGQSRVGKSLMALRLARAVMTGEPFCERQIVKTGGVLYLAAEAEGTLPDRYRAVLGAKFTPRDLRPQRDDLPFLTNNISFRGLDAMSGALKRGADRMLRRFKVPLRLVIVDTAAAAFPLANENEQGEVNNLMLSLLSLTKAAGVAVVLVHHFGKNSSTGVRGSSAWTDNSEFILAATGKLDEETGHVSDRKLSLTKSRSSATGPLSDFEVQSVQVGQRPDGRRVDAGIINFTAVRHRVGETPPHYDGFMNSAVAVLDGGVVTEVELRAQFAERAAADPNLPRTPEGVDKAFLLARDHALRTGALEPMDGNPAAFVLRRQE